MNIKSKKGMTLVEVIATVAIMAVIMIPISLIFTTAYSNFITESDKSIAQQSARAVLYGKGLYGDGLFSYGVMGDLQRSNAGKDRIVVDSQINGKGRILLIYDKDGLLYKYSFESATLKLKYQYRGADGNLVKEKDYFENDSSDKKEVKVLYFSVEKKDKGSDIDEDNDPDTHTYIDTDLIEVYVEVEYGKSGKVALGSSYRVPIE